MSVASVAYIERGEWVDKAMLRFFACGHDWSHASPDAPLSAEVASGRQSLGRVEKKRVEPEDVLRLHRIVAGEVMEQGDAGRYRPMRVRVGGYLPPPGHATFRCSL
jgi:hypothetical protein